MIEYFDQINGIRNGADSTSQHTQYQADIAIFGAGAAGITLARQFLGRPDIRVLLIESGGPDYHKATQDLYHGHISGEDYYELRESRLRFFGGTTAIWGGRSARFDAIDFEKRDWVDHSGWPINLQELEPYYAKAQNLLDLPPIVENQMPNRGDLQEDLLENLYRGDKERPALRSAYWQFDEKFSRFTLPACRDLQEAENIHILLKANLIGLETSENGQEIIGAQIAALPDESSQHSERYQAQVKCRHYILALGGLETPRLLLASKTKTHPNGIGNNHDQVGRYFMEHPHARGGRIITDDPARLFKTFPAFQRRGATGLYQDKKNIKSGKTRYGLLLRPSEQTQETHKILNSCFTFGVYRHEGEAPEKLRAAYGKVKHDMAPNAWGRGLWRVAKSVSRYVQEKSGPWAKLRLLKNPKYGIYTVMRAEQAPNPDSRVALSQEKDALGLPKIDMQWRFSEIDKYSVAGAMNALDQDLRHLGLGRVEPASWLKDPQSSWQFDDLVTSHAMGGYHHIGTTRMGHSPKNSVTDKDGRVHDVQNLHIAGSSLFPTSGWANPTLSILALPFVCQSL